MKELKVRRGKVGYPMTPSEWSGEPVFTEITRVKVSCGGGMGGASWYEYVKKIPMCFNFENMIPMERIDGKYISVNPKWIVMTEDFMFVRVPYTTKHPEYSKKPNRILEFLIEPGAEIEFVDRFDSESMI